ncbi:MAG: lysylphosphatidylglycerol synthase transmembrane domain-containing protein [Kofleriaceae bacterium]
MTTALGIGVRVVLIAAIGVLLWFFLREIDWEELGDALYHARIWPLIPAVAIAIAMLWCHAFSLGHMLAPRHVVPTPRLFRYTIVAYAASIITPLRAGELVRVWLLKRRDQVPVADSAAAVVAQKFIDGVTMLVFVAPVTWLLPDLPAWVGRVILIGAAIAVAVFVALYLALGYLANRVQTSWLARFIAGMHVLRSPRRLVLVVATLLAAWLADLVMVWCVLHAVGIELPLAAGLLILFTLNLTIMVPTPANLGSLEVGVFAATRLLGVPDAQALAFALLYHACLVVPILVAGLALEMRLLLGRTPLTS